ncbi:MAG: signal peptidase I [Myxococcales bacterium]|nr:MAG: signal peptidase I [Myxococcales bacterium]
MSHTKPKTEHWLSENIKTLGSALALAMLIRIVLFEAFEIEGPSMEPSLLNGDRVVVAKYKYGLFLPFTDHALFNWSGPKAGDVVILKSPMENIDIVKRVIGVAGDTIEVDQDAIIRNGKKISHRSKGECLDDACSTYGGSSDLFECTLWEEQLGEHRYAVSYATDAVDNMVSTRKTAIPEGHVFVMGDHRDHSNDSRYFGLVPVNRVKGKALSIYWSSQNADDYLNMGKQPPSWWERIRGCRVGSRIR